MLTSIQHVLTDGLHALVYPLLPVIASELHLSYAQASLIRGVFNTAGGALQLPAGILAERFGEWTLLVLGNAWLAAGVLGMGLVGSFYALLSVVLLGGIGANVQHPVGTGLISRAYDGPGRARAIGTLNFSGDLGKLIAPAIAGSIAVVWGWRYALLCSGAVALLLIVSSWVWTRGRGFDRASGHAATVAAAGRAQPDPARSAPGVAADALAPTPAPAPTTAQGRGQGRARGWGIKAPWALAALVSIGVLDSSVRGATLTLLPFVLTAQGLGTGAISALYTVIFAGGAAGKFVCGAVADRFGTLPMIWATEALTALSAVAFLVTPRWLLVPLALVFGFALNGTSSVLYAAVAPMVDADRRSRVYGIYYTATICASALAPVMYGALGDHFGLAPAFGLAALVTLLILPLSLSNRRYLK
ncbi:MAG: MFS transporter [Bacillota bacterium]|nr:MFS transporter [Bacillota bacterium]